MKLSVSIYIYFHLSIFGVKTRLDNKSFFKNKQLKLCSISWKKNIWSQLKLNIHSVVWFKCQWLMLTSWQFSLSFFLEIHQFYLYVQTINKQFNSMAASNENKKQRVCYKLWFISRVTAWLKSVLVGNVKDTL